MQKPRRNFVPFDSKQDTSDNSCLMKVENEEFDQNKFFAKFSQPNVPIPKQIIHKIKKIIHPAIVGIVALRPSEEDQGKRNTILFQYMENGSLASILSNNAYNKLTPDVKMRTIYGVASALKLLHSRNVYLGYLNAKNILYDAEFYPQINDLCFIKAFRNRRDRSTEMYYSKNIENNGEIIVNDDLYSFAVLLYQILTGRYEKPIFPLDDSFSDSDNEENHDDNDENNIKNTNEEGNNEESNNENGFFDIFNDNSYNKKEIVKKIPLQYRLLINECVNPTFESPSEAMIEILMQLSDKKFLLEGTNEEEFEKYKYLCYLSFNSKIETTEDNFLFAKRLIDGRNYVDGFSFLKNAIKMKNADAVLLLADLLIDGVYEPSDFNKAYHYLSLFLDDNPPINEQTQIQINARFLELQTLVKFYPAQQNYLSLSQLADGLSSINMQRAVKYFKIAAKHGVVSAIYKYGCSLYKGAGIPIDKEKGKKYLLKACEEGSIEAMSQFSKILYFEGNIDGSMKYMKMVADHQNVKAMHNYAVALIHKNEEIEASQEFINQKIHKNNDNNSNNNNNKNYNGNSSNNKVQEYQNNYQEALFYLKKAIKMGNTPSLKKYAEIIKNQDIEESLRCYEILLNNYQDIESSVRIGDIFFERNDFEKALEYYQYASKYIKGNIELKYKLALTLLQTVNYNYSSATNHSQIYQEAKKYLNEVKNKKPEAFLYLAEIADKEGNKDLHIKCLREAAKAGISIAFDYYYEETNDLNFIREEAEKGNPESFLIYGKITKNIEYIKKSADIGIAEGVYEYGCFLERKGNIEEAMECYLKCAQKKHTKSMVILGISYIYGWGKEKNLQLGLDYLVEANHLGNKVAELILREYNEGDDVDSSIFHAYSILK
ncbi:hypothetical protein TRFO_16848 [Tritrichomonas foetus]|uniref:Protein kinase domain-containing protein n=1 Tax=Tritrichomonas foetus TaxID=1144522 RepID=A0A1J4KPR1_9EUKA|nr:hypothetical protein TRFO_16848 [Tritrichomonas foetus]|eukprot:OHT13098.1 hypothetical protein TRFO_16848 [Tritrichomonas foetus]